VGVGSGSRVRMELAGRRIGVRPNEGEDMRENDEGKEEGEGGEVHV